MQNSLQWLFYFERKMNGISNIFWSYGEIITCYFMGHYFPLGSWGNNSFREEKIAGAIGFDSKYFLNKRAVSSFIKTFSQTVTFCIAGFHLTSWKPCWHILNKGILIISFVWETNMAITSVVFCVSWDCVKTSTSYWEKSKSQYTILWA